MILENCVFYFLHIYLLGGSNLTAQNLTWFDPHEAHMLRSNHILYLSLADS